MLGSVPMKSGFYGFRADAEGCCSIRDELVVYVLTGLRPVRPRVWSTQARRSVQLPGGEHLSTRWKTVTFFAADLTYKEVRNSYVAIQRYIDGRETKELQLEGVEFWRLVGYERGGLPHKRGQKRRSGKGRKIAGTAGAQPRTRITRTIILGRASEPSIITPQKRLDYPRECLISPSAAWAPMRTVNRIHQPSPIGARSKFPVTRLAHYSDLVGTHFRMSSQLSTITAPTMSCLELIAIDPRSKASLSCQRVVTLTSSAPLERRTSIETKPGKCCTYRRRFENRSTTWLAIPSFTGRRLTRAINRTSRSLVRYDTRIYFML